MACRERQTALQRYLMGESGRDESRELERHLGACPDCARDLAHYRALFRALPLLPEPEPPASLHADLVAALDGERWAWRRDREPVWQTRVRRAFVGVMLTGFAVTLTVALWSWMGRIASFSALRFSRDLLSLRDAVESLGYLITLLGRAFEGPWALLRHVGQPLGGWGPAILATYCAALLLGGGLLWRALRQANERGVRHASHVSVS